MSRFFLAALFLLYSYIPVAIAQPAAPTQSSAAPLLKVGTKHAPPFSIKNEDGTWSGISIDLWRDIAVQLNLNYEIVETDLKGLLEGVQDGSIDASVAALTITGPREEMLDFTHPFYTTGLSVAMPAAGKDGAWKQLASRLFSWQFFQIIGSLTLVLFIVGFLMWLCERKHNRENDRWIGGLGEGFWWAAVTMTTVGYGDKTPLTTIGRSLALIWMFLALMLVASFIAAFTTALTVNELGSNIESVDDLSRLKVATIPASTSQAFLNRHAISSENYPSPIAGLKAVAEGKVNGIVYDAPLLKYLTRKEFPGQLEVLPVIFERQDYGIALPTGSLLREPINRVMLNTITQPLWQNTLQRYLGK